MTDHVNHTTPTIEQTSGKERSDKEVLFYEHMPAGFWVRFWAYLIDLIVVASASSILVKPVFLLIGADTSTTSWYAPYAIVTAVVFYGYFVLMTKFFSQTVGKMILGLKVISLKEDKLTWGTLLFREWIGRFISTTILPLYWIVGFTSLKQGVHDFVADTTVIHENSYRKQKMVQKVPAERSELQDA